MDRDHQYSYGFDFKSFLTSGVRWLIIINVVMFILSLIFENLFSYLTLIPQEVIENYYLWQPFTYMFLHINAGHLVWNLLMLFFIGGFVERSMGTFKFIRFYLFVGITTGILYTAIVVLLNIIFEDFILYDKGVLGSSGAILGVLMVLCLMHWDSYLWFWGLFPIKGKWLIFIVTAIAVLGTLSSFRGKECVSHLAHLLGLGIAYLYYEKPFGRWKHPFKRKRKVKSVFEEEYFHTHND